MATKRRYFRYFRSDEIFTFSFFDDFLFRFGARYPQYSIV